MLSIDKLSNRVNSYQKVIYKNQRSERILQKAVWKCYTNRDLKVLFIFVDGVGLRGPAVDNPVNAEVCPTFWRLIKRHAKPIDACLGVDGVPQSATGQGTIFTGVNCAKAMGRHCEGFPGPNLRKIVEESNIFLQLKGKGKKVKFADAYLVDSVDELRLRRFKSVTTVMALTVPESVSTVEDLMSDSAVMQDLTRETIQDRYPDIPVIPPQRAAEHLFAVSQRNDFTLYEFYQTDVSGHLMDYARSCAVLRTFDRFLTALVRYAEAARTTLVITSDHGNIESSGTGGHTRNSVPFIAFGPGESFIRERVSSLADVTPSVLAAFDAF